MPKRDAARLPSTDLDRLRSTLQSSSLRDVARRAGVSFETVRRAASGGAVTEATAVALRRASPHVRTADEFSGAGAAAVHAPLRRLGVEAHDSQSDALLWIRQARNEQIAGRFAKPVRLAEAMRTDDALFTAYHNRIAWQAAIDAELVGHDSQRGRNVAAKALAHIVAPRDTLQGIAGTLANHGVAIGYIEHEPNDDGTIVSFRLTEWPLEHVRWNTTDETLETQTRDGSIVPIVHGDGRWIVFRGFGLHPWSQSAAILPASFVYAAHAEGIADWAGASRAHGLAKIIGQLPEGVTMRKSDGSLTSEADAYLTMLADLVSGEASAGVHAHGGDAKFLANGSTAWQVFSELVQNRERAAARIYLGTDAYLGQIGDAPGVDIAALFGIATTKIQGDVRALTAGLDSGLAQPWTAINFGDSRYAPSYAYALPDPDEAKNREAAAVAAERLAATLAAYREQRISIDQAVVDRLASAFGVSPAPRLADVTEDTSSINLAPTDVAKVVRVREARAASGLPPFGDERDDMTLTELDERNKASAAAEASNAEAPAPAPADGDAA